VWGVAWTARDEVLSVSADGIVKKWNSTSAQVSQSLPAHPLAIVSVDTSADGRYALYNTLEGLICLWDLETGNTVGKHESYVRDSKETAEPGK
jgi:WD repeat-containing protein 61